jgi:hypothetical protein
MWESYEQGLAAALATESGGAPTDPGIRTTAALLITPFRVLTSSDVRAAATDTDVAAWIDACFDLIDAGLAP